MTLEVLCGAGSTICIYRGRLSRWALLFGAICRASFVVSHKYLSFKTLELGELFVPRPYNPLMRTDNHLLSLMRRVQLEILMSTNEVLTVADHNLSINFREQLTIRVLLLRCGRVLLCHLDCRL